MACTRRPIPRRDIDKMADDIEAELQRSGSGVVKSRDLGLMVLDRLRLLDEVAYVRYASVYYDFQNARRLRGAGQVLPARPTRTVNRGGCGRDTPVAPTIAHSPQPAHWAPVNDESPDPTNFAN